MHDISSHGGVLHLRSARCPLSPTRSSTARARAGRRAALGRYEYGYHKFCECHRESPPETIVTVRDGSVVGVRHRPAGSDAEVPAADKNLEYYWTVEGCSP